MLKFQRDNLEVVKEIIPFLNPLDPPIFRRLSQVTWKTINEGKIEEAMNLLDMCKDVPFWIPCIVDLYQLLDQQGKQDQCNQLMNRFPAAFTNRNKRIETFYYAFTN